MRILYLGLMTSSVGFTTAMRKHRTEYVWYHLTQNAAVQHIIVLLKKRTLLLNMNSKHSIVRIFIEDALAGRHWDNRELLKPKK